MGLMGFVQQIFDNTLGIKGTGWTNQSLLAIYNLLSGTSTLAIRVEETWEHNHSAQRVAPSGAAAIAVTSGVGAWNLGAFSNDIIAAAAEPFPFDIHGIDVENPNANAAYEIVLYGDSGAGDVEIGRATFTRTNATTVSRSTNMQTPIQPAGTRIRAKLMDSAGGNACNIKVWYHHYT